MFRHSNNEQQQYPPIINKVKHISSTKSDVPLIRSYKHQISLWKNFTSQSKKNVSRLQIIALYDERKNWCQHIEKKIQVAEDKLKKYNDKETVISQEIKIKKQELIQFERKLFQLKCEGRKILIKLKKEQDELKIVDLEMEAQFNAKQIKNYQKQLPQFNQKLDSLSEKQKKYWQSKISELQRYIQENTDRLIKEEFPTLPPIVSQNK